MTGQRPSATPTLLVVQHEPGCPPDRLGEWLADEGVRLDVLRPDLGQPVPERVEHDGLVVLGGRVGAYDDAEAPWLPATRRLLATAVREQTPTLGICLGAQLLAVACGGRVEVAPHGIEAGVVDVHWRPEAADDPLLAPDGPSTAAPSMHLDHVVELPPDAVRLGATVCCRHHAFRVGSSAWGVQYHPEVSLRTFTAWAAGHREDWPRWGLDGEAVVGQLAARDAEVADAGRRLATRFAGLLRTPVVPARPAAAAKTTRPAARVARTRR